MNKYSIEHEIAMPNLDLLIYKNGSRRKSKGKPHGLIPVLDIVDKVSIDVADALATAMIIQKIHQYELGYGQLANFGAVPDMPSHITDLVNHLMLVPAFAEEWAEAEEVLDALKLTYKNMVPTEQRRRAAPGKKQDALGRSAHVPVFRPLLRILSSEFNMQADRHSGGGGSSSSSSTTRQQHRRQQQQQQEPPQLFPSFKQDDPMEALSMLLRAKRLLQRYVAGILANLTAGGYMVVPLDTKQKDFYELPYFMKVQALSILVPDDFFGKHTSYSAHCRRQHKLDGALQKIRRADCYASRPFCGTSNRWGLYARVPATAKLSSKKLAATGSCCCHWRCRLCSCSSTGSSSSFRQQEVGRNSAASSASQVCSSDSGGSTGESTDAVGCTPHHASSGCSGGSSSSNDCSCSSSGGRGSGCSDYTYVKTPTISRCKINRRPPNSVGSQAHAVTGSASTSSTSSCTADGSTNTATANNRTAAAAPVAIKSWWKAAFGKISASNSSSGTGIVSLNIAGLHDSDATCCILDSSSCSKSKVKGKGKDVNGANVSWVKAAYLMFTAPA